MNALMIHCERKARWFLCIGLSLLFFEGRSQGLYDKVYAFGDFGAQWALVKVDRQYGFINDKGEEVVKPMYDKIEDFGEYQKHWAKVKVDRQYGFINDKGEEVVKPIYDKIYPFGEHKSGWAMVVLDGQIGFIDETGKIIPAD